jgi:hypothetical protein
MLMTEDEAKAKWCPFSRFKFASTSDVTSCNREGGPGVGPNEGGVNPWLLSGTRCIASACMAWRTAQVGQVLPGDEYKTYREEGFCGLAGASQ